MSRKYCEDCREPHDNGVLGLCDACITGRAEIENRIARAREARRASFMALSDEEKWGAVFDTFDRMGVNRS